MPLPFAAIPYRPMVTPPKGSSRTQRQPVMPGTQTPTVSAIPQAGGGMVNVQSFGESMGTGAGGLSKGMFPQAMGQKFTGSVMPQMGGAMGGASVYTLGVNVDPGMPPGVNAPPMAGGILGGGSPMYQMNSNAQTAPAAPTPGQMAQQQMQSQMGWNPTSAITAHNLSGPGGTPLVRPGGDYVIYRDAQYNPTAQQRSELDTAVRRDREYNAADPAGPYNGSAGLNRFNSLRPQEQHQERQLMPGTVMPGGSVVVSLPGGKQALVGPGLANEVRRQLGPDATPQQINDAVGIAYQRGGQIPSSEGGNEAARTGNINRTGGHVAYRDTDNGPIGGYAPGQEAKRDIQVQKQRDKKAMLRERRQNRAIDKYDLPLGKTYKAPGNVDPRTATTAQSSTVAADAPIAERQAALSKAVSHPIFADAATKGFDPGKASMSQAAAYYMKNRGNWSSTDKQAFKEYLTTNANSNKGGDFDKQLQRILKESEVTVDPTTGKPDVNEINAIREVHGLPPVKVKYPKPPAGTGPTMGGGAW